MERVWPTLAVACLHLCAYRDGKKEHSVRRFWFRSRAITASRAGAMVHDCATPSRRVDHHTLCFSRRRRRKRRRQTLIVYSYFPSTHAISSRLQHHILRVHPPALTSLDKTYSHHTWGPTSAQRPRTDHQTKCASHHPAYDLMTNANSPPRSSRHHRQAPSPQPYAAPLVS